jgi:DNA-binding NtrC family response regulator
VAERISVLVVDDEPIVGKRLGPALTRDGYDVEVCESGQEAVDRINARDFDIVVTDVRMEDIDGLRVLDHVMGKSPKTKVIIITGYATIEMAREALAKGAYDFIAKPFKPKDLRAVVAKAALSLGHKAIL